jgi:hypothetical protein
VAKKLKRVKSTLKGLVYGGPIDYGWPGAFLSKKKYDWNRYGPVHSVQTIDFAIHLMIGLAGLVAATVCVELATRRQFKPGSYRGVIPFAWILLSVMTMFVIGRLVFPGP